MPGPIGIPRGASFSWYLYSPLRVRYPYVRGILLELYREALARTGDPVDAWADVVLLSLSLGHTDDAESTLRRCALAARPGGRVVVADVERSYRDAAQFTQKWIDSDGKP